MNLILNTHLKIVALFLASKLARAIDNGLGLSPPMGWRSWNFYMGNVHQDEIEEIMNGMVRRTRMDHEGHLVSLCDLGYCDVGVDDTWQRCGSPQAAPGMHYHDIDGNPIINLDRFPSIQNMTRHAKHLGLTAGWYANNCACSDHCRNETECSMQIRQDVKALVEYGFSSLKIDGCGNQKNLTAWDRYIKEFSNNEPILVEQCRANDPDLGNGCPTYNFYRTSADIRNNYGSIMNNLGSVEKFRKTNSSYPGCWAYADMLYIGIRGGLTIEESRSHFAGWSIVSSPLILSHDVNDDEVMDRIWDIISNREILEVNQAYHGDSGGVYDSSNEMIKVDTGMPRKPFVEVPIYQYLYKPISNNKVAVLLMNSDDKLQELKANFEDIPGLGPSCSEVGADEECVYLVRDLWNHIDLGIFHESWSKLVESHDAAFITVEKKLLVKAEEEEEDGEAMISATSR